MKKTSAASKLLSDEHGGMQLTEDKQLEHTSFNSRNLFDDSNKEDAAWLLLVKNLLKRKQ